MLEPEQFFLDHLPLIEQIIASTGRRKGMDAAAIEEFDAEVKLRLVDNDYAVIRAFQGRSSFATYISAVVAHILLDLRNHEWGKWHASAEAERAGAVALDLEQHLYRDGRSLDEAYEELLLQHPEVTREEVDALYARLRKRVRRRMVELEEANTVEAARDTESVDCAETAKKLSDLIGQQIAKLSENDQLLLRLRFDMEMTIPQIAQSLRADEQWIYRRLYKIFKRLRTALKQGGIAWRDVTDLIGEDRVLLDFRQKKRKTRPSQTDDSEAAGRKKETP
jgi:RNA polymerase sigma factor (sigma-70 family)